jgi:hypothetical protein
MLEQQQPAIKMWSGRFREPIDRTFEQWQRSFPFAMIVVLFVAFSARCHAQISVTPNGKPWRCNYAKTKTTVAAVPVFHTPAKHSRQVVSLRRGAIVYTCDEWGDWYKVSFPSSGKRCSTGTQDGLPNTKKSDCNSGWVQKKFIVIISG